MKTAYIIDAVRTPMGRYGGKLANIRPDDMMAHAIKALLDRNPLIDTSLIEDVVVGAANQAGEDNRNVGRMAALLAGLPTTVAGNTVNRLCGSGMEAIMAAARAIACNEGMIYIAGGVESMTRAPFVVPKASKSWDRSAEMYDSTIGWRFTNPLMLERCQPLSMGQTAEILAKKHNINRERQDAYAYASHLKYFKAQEHGYWDTEIVAIPTNTNNQNSILTIDEPPRKLTMQALQSLKPVFDKMGTVTAGNSSGLNDGAAALLMASGEAVSLFGLEPMARVVSMSVAGVHPDDMGEGPIPATKKALVRAGLGTNDLGLIELNESFACQALYCMDNLGLNPELVNISGGSIALGQPMGCIGARIVVTLVHNMKRLNVRYGLATIPVGLGQGGAMIVESC